MLKAWRSLPLFLFFHFSYVPSPHDFVTGSSVFFHPPDKFWQKKSPGVPPGRINMGNICVLSITCTSLPDAVPVNPSQRKCSTLFSHPDCTVGFGIAPNQSLARVADCHRRSGIAPCPEEPVLFVFILRYFFQVVNYSIRTYERATVHSRHSQNRICDALRCCAAHFCS